MTGKDDPTISSTHLMVKLSVLEGRKIILKGDGNNHPSGRRGLNKTTLNIENLSLVEGNRARR